VATQLKDFKKRWIAQGTMTQHFRLDGVEYDLSDLSERGQTLVDRLVFVRTQIIELSNQAALLSKAKNAYIADLKFEIIEGRSGVDLGALFSGD
jgi:hypothetical protein